MKQLISGNNGLLASGSKHPIQRKWLLIAQDLLDFCLRVLLWLSVNILIALGLCVVGFAMMANLHWVGIFQELENLSRHYLAGSAALRAEFEQLLLAIIAVTFLIVAAARRHSISREQDYE